MGNEICGWMGICDRSNSEGSLTQETMKNRYANSRDIQRRLSGQIYQDL